MIDAFEGSTSVGLAVRDADGCRTAGLEVALPVFSVTKMFVATAFLRRAERGELALDDESPLAGLSIRELLNHTGGLPDYGREPAYQEAVAARPSDPWGLDEIVRVGLAGEWSARGAFHYSNVGYWLLGSLLEPLGETLATEVFEPAGMATTRYPDAIGEGVTESGYDTLWAGPAGATWSTPADVALFLRRLFDGTLLSPKSLAELTAPVPVADAGEPWVEPAYGLGLMVDKGLCVAGHGGGGPGYTSAAFLALDTHHAAAAIARSDTDVDPLELVLSLIR